MSNGFRFSISATFTAEPVEAVIAFWAKELESEFEVEFAPYNQVMQSLADPASLFAKNRRGLNVILLRAEDLGQFEAYDEAAAGQVQTNVTAALEAAAGTAFSVPLLIVTCPASPRFPHEIRVAAPQKAGVHLLEWQQVAELYPVAEWYNAEGDRLGKIPLTEAGFAALGTAMVRHAVALSSPPYKVIVSDCDNTLWKGVCGEDGPRGVAVDEARWFLHEFLLRQRDAGMLLAMASKNNDPDVLETFAQNPEWPLRADHFTTRRINWRPKTENLPEMAAELGLGLDSFIFLDDDARECAEIREELPEVLMLPLPRADADIPHFLRHVWAFDHPVITAEDRARAESYRQAVEFGRAVHSAVSIEEFFRSLDLRVTIRPLTPDHVARVAQLTQRTNQFNFTTIRRTEAEIAALTAAGVECWTMEVADRFGEYGLTGVLLFEAVDEALRVDSFLLSCRVLGRGVEHHVMRWLGDMALTRGMREIEITAVETAKNAPARQFLSSILGEAAKAGVPYRFSASYLTSLEPSAAVAVPVEDRPKSAAAPKRRIDFARIARELNTVDAIMARMRPALGGRANGSHPPVTELEQKLAAIWSELLGQAAVSLDDNFFDLGGHSLIAVLLLAKIKETIGVEVPIDEVYSGDLTLGKLAAAVESQQLAATDPEEYAALLAELESMSDEEVRELLAREEGSGAN